jgi:predicted N-acyltransferase
MGLVLACIFSREQVVFYPRWLIGVLYQPATLMKMLRGAQSYAKKPVCSQVLSRL